ncbi:hypothetical protein PENSPDRAFT_703321 [Peniophora sp. CONT]|nr:hypothetical protein PENSPDRAFT_703321 [Peniophora sp. CONT]
MARASYGPLPLDDISPTPTRTMHSRSSSLTASTLIASPNAQSTFGDGAKPARRVSMMSSAVASIPTPGTVHERPPRYEPLLMNLWVVLPGSILLVALGIALEITLSISQDRHGFNVPEKNVFSFASTQFLTSFFPSLIILPIGFLVRSFDSQILAWQPYLVLDRGNARPQESIMLSYVLRSTKHRVIFSAFIYRHKLLLVSTITVLLSLTFQPLAGSLFAVTQQPVTTTSTVMSNRGVGLNPDRGDLTAFAASAGADIKIVSNILVDPPFIFNGWASAEFVFTTNQYLNGSMAVNTSGVQTDVGCSNPAQINLNTADANNYSLTASSSQGCNLGPATFNPNSASALYGAVPVANCAADSQTDPEFMPVFFWFYQQNNVAGVFCMPTLQLFNVTAHASLQNGTLTSVDKHSDFAQPNNVTGDILHGPVRAFNGLFFNETTDANVEARAKTIASTMPNAIFSQAKQNDAGVQAVFEDPNGFLNITTTLYTKYLALAATSVYFTPSTSELPSKLTRLVDRLIVEPLPAHALSIVSIICGLICIAVHLYHHRARRNVYLPHHPGDIASAVAMTAHSGFGELLYPYDNDSTIAGKLDGLRFRLDRRTSAIVVDSDSRDPENPSYMPEKFTQYDQSSMSDSGKSTFARGDSFRTVTSLGVIREDNVGWVPQNIGDARLPPGAGEATPPPSRGQERAPLL